MKKLLFLFAFCAFAIAVSAQCYSSFEIHPPNFCKGDIVTATATTQVGLPPFTFHWSNGATTSSVTLVPTGTVSLGCTVTDATGCVVVNSQPITSIMKPTPTVNIYTVGKPCYKIFGADAGCDFVHWSTGDIGPTTEVTNSSQLVIATVENSFGCFDSDTAVVYQSPCVVDTFTEYQTIYVDTCIGGGSGGPKPVANFTVSNNQGCGPLVVQFSDLSSNNPTSWQWSFPGGNPATSTAQNPSVVYNPSGSGNYSASLIATNANGSSNTFSLSNVIHVKGQAPQILSVSATPPQIWTGDISELSVFVAGSGTYAYAWSNAGSLNNPSYQNPVAAPAVTTPYIVQVTDVNTTCTSLGYVTVTVIGTVSSNEVDRNYFEVVADLSQDDILIKASVEHYQALLVDVKGVIHRHKNCNEYETSFSKVGLVPGDYFLNILVGNNIYSQTITVVQ